MRMEPWKKKLIKWKIIGSGAETAREFGQWYAGKWKSDYPDLYEPLPMPSFSTMYRRRPRRPIYAYTVKGRRRLAAKRAIVVTPSRNVRARRAGGRVYGGGRGKAFLFGRANVGQRVGEGTTKRSVTDTKDQVTRETRAANIFDMTAITQGDAVNERERFIANVRGFKVQLYCRNIINSPICFNYAILAGRSKNVISQNDLFRSIQGNIRAGGFDGRSGMQISWSDINTDEYVCLKHKRVFISEAEPRADQPFNTQFSKSSWWSKELYMPLKRQMRWASAESTSCNEKVFLVYWVSKIDETEGTDEQVEVAQISHTVTCYFKEPKN